jgi:RNA polymerase sigma factor (sigma-70 family)
MSRPKRDRQDQPTGDGDRRADEFERHRPRLRAVAYRMLGSLSEADDAVQESWLRFSRTDTADVDNLGAWLTTVVARLCLDILRTRRARREQPIGVHVPDPIVSPADGLDPEQEAILADSVGMAMLVVLDTLSPAERLAYVLHDTFGLPFDQIAPIVGRSTTTTRQLASRARRRLKGQVRPPDVDPARQRRIVEAFRQASRVGDFDALLRVLDPDVVVRGDWGVGRPSGLVRGAHEAAREAQTYRRLADGARPALVNGTPGFVIFADDRPFAVLGFTIHDDRITEIDILADPVRLAGLDLAAVDA